MIAKKAFYGKRSDCQNLTKTVHKHEMKIKEKSDAIKSISGLKGNKTRRKVMSMYFGRMVNAETTVLPKCNKTFLLLFLL